MNSPNYTSQTRAEQLADTLKTLEREKVKLTPKIEKEIREHLAEAQARAERGEPMTQEMAEFMENVRLWAGMPEFWRNSHPSIDIKTLKEVTKGATMKTILEACKRNIVPKQWLDLLHVTKVAKRDRKWIDGEFDFPGDGRIQIYELDLSHADHLNRLPDNLEIEDILRLSNRGELTELPKGLKVMGSLFLHDCFRLEQLPEDLVVGNILCAEGCSGLQKNKSTVLPLLFRAISEGRIKGLALDGWPLEDADLAIGLKVEKNLIFDECKNLTMLPRGLEVGGILCLNKCDGLMENKKTALPMLFEAVQSGRIKGLSLDDWPLEKGDLPEGLNVRGDLSLQSCKTLDRLPNSLKVGGDLYLNGCDNLRILPHNLDVGGNLFLYYPNYHLKEDAKRLKREGKIKGIIRV